jgi:hypothetical protein
LAKLVEFFVGEARVIWRIATEKPGVLAKTRRFSRDKTFSAAWPFHGCDHLLSADTDRSVFIIHRMIF